MKMYLRTLGTAAIAVLTLSSPTSAEAGNGSPGATAKAFSQAGDSRDVAELEKILHKDFMVAFVVKGTSTLSQMSKADYIGLIKAKKIGGDARRLKVLKTDIQNDLAFVRLRQSGAQADFESMQTLLKTADGWQVVHEAVLFAPKS